MENKNRPSNGIPIEDIEISLRGTGGNGADPAYVNRNKGYSLEEGMRRDYDRIKAVWDD